MQDQNTTSTTKNPYPVSIVFNGYSSTESSDYYTPDIDFEMSEELLYLIDKQLFSGEDKEFYELDELQRRGLSQVITIIQGCLGRIKAGHNAAMKKMEVAA